MKKNKQDHDNLPVFKHLFAGETIEDIGSEGMVQLMNGYKVKAKNLLEVDIPSGTSVVILKDNKTKKDYIYSANI